MSSLSVRLITASPCTELFHSGLAADGCVIALYGQQLHRSLCRRKARSEAHTQSLFVRVRCVRACARVCVPR